METPPERGTALPETVRKGNGPGITPAAGDAQEQLMIARCRRDRHLRSLELVASWRADLQERIDRAQLILEAIGLSRARQDALICECRAFNLVCRALAAECEAL
jgi:hypothetical protein